MTPVLYWLIYCGVGKLLMYTLRKFPPAIKIAERYEFARQLLDCYFCLGVWFYTFLAFVFGINLVHYEYIPFISELTTGCVTSFVVYVFCIGWESSFGVYVIDGTK